ncbi:MAG: IclR family transcriptional regulator [Rhodoglobus sp.]
MTDATDNGAGRTQDMVGKALSLLTLLGEYPHGAVASALARESGFPLSTAHRLLGILVREGFAKFDQTTRQYAVGIRIFELAQSVSVAYGFAGMTRPILEELSAITKEASLLTVRDNDRQLYVQTIAGPQQVSVNGEPGRHGPLHCTAVGKVLTAFAVDSVREQLLASISLDACSPNSITDRAAFRLEIEKVRRLGYAIADEEHELGIRAIAVPVFVHGEVVAALATAAPAYRASVERLEEYVPHLHETARSLATVMALQ